MACSHDDWMVEHNSEKGARRESTCSQHKVLLYVWSHLAASMEANHLKKLFPSPRLTTESEKAREPIFMQGVEPPTLV